MPDRVSTGEQEVARAKRAAEKQRLRITRPLVFSVAAVLLILASVPPRPSLKRLEEFQINEPAPFNVFSPFEFKIIDKEKTNLARLEAEKKVHRTYRKIPRVVEDAQRKWKALSQIVAHRRHDPWRKLSEAEISQASRSAWEFWKERLDTKQRDLLTRKFKDYIWKQDIQAKITKSLQDSEILADEEEVRQLRPESGDKVVPWNLIDLDDTIKNRPTGLSVLSVTEEIRILARQIAGADIDSGPDDEDLALKLAQWLVVPTLEFDATVYERARMLAREKVPSVSIEIKQGAVLARRGELVTQEDYDALLELKKRKESKLGEIGGRAILILVALWIFAGYLKRYEKDLYRDVARLSVLLGLVALISWIGFLLVWGGFVSEEMESPVGYVIPISVIGILVTILENSRLAIFSVVLTTFLAGIQYHWDLSVLIVLAFTATAAVYHVMGANLRSQIYLASLWILGSGMVMSTGVHLTANPSWQAFANTLTPFLYGWLWLALNGFLSVGISLLLLPLLEDLVGVTTEFKLRELSVSHPLLRRLEEVAPGTYYHSLNVSVLGEAAAAAIGANALLVKVAAYYHDIGKMEKPSYFAENQFTEEDRRKHSKISPHMSCLIIRNHVKIGLEMAREHRLPEALWPFIAEHHGTTLISYFYDMARSEDPHGTISESDFRYPGPKPQTIESAVLMLADTIEAASRSMDLVGEGEIRVFVKRMINEKMIDGQFDECPLTFKELSILAESFTRTLKTMMQRRIAYPSTPEVELPQKTARGENVRPLFNREAAPRSLD